jgi:hypothetical protein
VFASTYGRSDATGYLEGIQRVLDTQQQQQQQQQQQPQQRGSNASTLMALLQQTFPESILSNPSTGFVGVSPSHLALITMNGVRELAEQVPCGHLLRALIRSPLFCGL